MNESKPCAICKGPNALSTGICKECQAMVFSECHCETCESCRERGS